VRTGAGTLKVIDWCVSGGIERVGDSRDQAGDASRLSNAAAGLYRTYLTAARTGGGALKIIAFGPGDHGPLTRIGETNNIDDNVSETSIAGLRDGRAVTAHRVGGFLRVITWSVSQSPD